VIKKNFRHIQFVYCFQNGSPEIVNTSITSESRSVRKNYPTLRSRTKRHLHVCVAKAVHMGNSIHDGFQPYVIMEMDEPSQRYRTEIGQMPNGLDPVWNQTFTL
jgi:hypothetical protein